MPCAVISLVTSVNLDWYRAFLELVHSRLAHLINAVGTIYL